MVQKGMVFSLAFLVVVFSIYALTPAKVDLRFSPDEYGDEYYDYEGNVYEEYGDEYYSSDNYNPDYESDDYSGNYQVSEGSSGLSTILSPGSTNNILLPSDITDLTCEELERKRREVLDESYKNCEANAYQMGLFELESGCRISQIYNGENSGTCDYIHDLEGEEYEKAVYYLGLGICQYSYSYGEDLLYLLLEKCNALQSENFTSRDCTETCYNRHYLCAEYSGELVSACRDQIINNPDAGLAEHCDEIMQDYGNLCNVERDDCLSIC